MAASFLTEEQRADEAIRFFQTLCGKRKVSLARATITGRKAGKGQLKFHEGESRFKPWSMSLQGHVRSMIKKSDKEVEIFYAPTPMSGTKGRKKEQALPSSVVFGDADEGLTAAAKAKLISMGACLVRSGGHVNNDTSRPKYHVYLLLTREVPPAELERLNRGLKAFIKGDKFDATTLLRVPGTRNHKYPGSPIVRVECYADKSHDPDTLASEFGVADEAVTSAVKAKNLPEIPEGFDPHASKPGYAHVWRVVKMWNGRWNDPTQDIRRYTALYAICGEAIERSLTIEEAYGFASLCEPLLDKQEEENGFSIQRDIVGAWRKKSAEKAKLTTKDMPTTPGVSSQSGPVGHSDAVPGFDAIPFVMPDLDELLTGEYKPLEPTMVTCGSYHLLYPGKSHSLASDRGVGKTHVTIAMVHEVMKAGGRVAYFDFEDSPDTFIRGRMINEHGISVEMIKSQFLYFGGIIAEDEVGTMGATEAIVHIAEKLRGWDLVVIDGVSASMSDWSTEEDCPSPMLDGSKATDYAWWHKRQVKPFLDAGIATFQIDHTNKTGGGRVGGTGQKGAKLTGVEYELRADRAGSLKMGATGRLILRSAKDRIGRVERFARGGDDDETRKDVATFVMSSTLEGKITRAMFEPIHEKHGGTAPPQTRRLTPEEAQVINVLVENGKPLNKTALKKKIPRAAEVVGKLIDDMIKAGLLGSYKEGRSIMIVPIDSAPSKPIIEGEGRRLDIDFERVPDPEEWITKKEGRRECRKCGDHVLVIELAQPDDIGYTPGRPMCKPCAAEPIDVETQWAQDGPERARRIRESIERDSTPDEDE